MTPIDRASKTPAYQQLAAVLRDEIKAGQLDPDAEGVLKPGAKLPSEKELEESYGVSRQTVRLAMRDLRSEGHLILQPGRGLFVRDQPRVVRVARNRLSRDERQRTGGTFSADMAAVGLTPRVETEVSLLGAEQAVAVDLDIDEGAQVLARRRKMYGSHLPMQMATSYFPGDLVRGSAVEQVNTGPGGVYARLEEMGHRLVSPFVERVSARAPSRGEREWFDLPEGVPVLLVTRVARTADRVVEVNQMILRGDWYELVYEIAAV